MWDFTKEQKVADTGGVEKFVAELLAKSERDLIQRAQAVINAVEAGDAAKVGLPETAAIYTLLTESVYRAFHTAAGDVRRLDINKVSKLGNLQAKLTHQLKQSSAWQYRINERVGKHEGLGRNDSRMAGRIIRRATTTGDGCFDEAL